MANTRKSRKRRRPDPVTPPAPAELPEPQLAEPAPARGYARSRERDEAARAALKPLRPGERPTAVTVGAIFAGLMAVANLVALGFGYNAAEDTLSPGSKLTGSILATGILGLMAWGMWKARYWAVLGMQTLLALTLIVASLGLITATTLWAAVLLVLIIAASGTLFWFLVKAMARIQMPERPGSSSQRSIGSAPMPDKEYDCIVIGSGPGGYVAAIRAAQLGLKTAVVEKGNTGGRCLNEACIPAKSILRVAEVMSEVEHAGSFGISTGDVSFDYSGATKHRDKVVKTLTGGVGMLFEKNKIELIEGFGSVTDDANVKIGGQFDGTEIKTDRVILATGSVAKPLLDLQFGKRILDTAGMWLLNEQPTRLCVIGAGASGVEIASAFGRLGTEVVLLEALDQILPLEDEEISKACAREIKKQNVRIETGANVESADVVGSGVTLAFNDESDEFDYLVIAAGRAPDVEGLGLEEAGIERDDRGLIKVDGRLRTSLDGVWAIGDMVPGPALAHKASDEGIIAVEDAAGNEVHEIDYTYIPAVTFCHPQVASFGMTEKAARDAGYDVVVGKVPMGAVGAPTVYNDRGGLVKIVGDKKYGEILGAHICSVKAADLIQELVNARELEGGFAEVARTIHAHPSFAETVMEAARATDGWLIHG